MLYLSKLSLQNTSANWNITTNRTGTVQDGTIVLVQFKVSGASPSAVLALQVHDNWRWGIQIYTDNKVDAQWNNGGGWNYSTLLPSGAFKRDVWYVLMLGVDSGTDLVRLWERDAAPENGAVLTYQADAMSSGQTWQFKVYANNGSVYLDTYHELKLFSESESTIAASAIALQSGWSLIDKDNKTLVGVNGYWTRPTTEKALTFNNDTKFVGRASDYGYDAYGNVTAVVEKAWNGSSFVAYRATQRGFYPNTTNKWLVGLPAYENRYACPSGNCDYGGDDLTGSVWYLYDGQSSYNVAPTTGKLTGNRTFICYANSSNGCVTFGSHSKTLYSDADYGYDSYGNRTSQTVYTNYGDGSTRATTTARTTTFAYVDGSRNTYKTSETNPAGHVTGWLYNYRLSVPTQETDPNGVVTTAEYDVFGRLTKIIRPGDSSASPTVLLGYYDYGVNNTGPFTLNLQQKHSGGVYDLRKFYDGFGQLLQTQIAGAQVNGAAQDVVVDYAYNGYGKATQQTVPYAISPWNLSGTPYRGQQLGTQPKTVTSYDRYGRVIQLSPPTTSETVYYFYNQDLTVVARNARGYDTTTIQDIWGRVVEMRPPNDPWLRYKYDTADRLFSVEKRTGSGDGTLFATTTMNYDVAGRKTSMNDIDMGAWTYSYDALGNLTGQTDARGCTTTLTYNDGLNRLTNKSYSGSCGVTTSAVAYGYDDNTSGNKGKGQRTSMSDGSGSTVWFYGDNRGRMTKETKTVTGGGAFVTQWAYDSGDQVTSMTYPDNETVTYSYLPQMVVNSVVGSSTYVQSSQVDTAGRVELRKFGADQIRTDYNYRGWDTQGGRLQWTRSGTPNGSTVNATLQDFTYNYDADGNVTSIVDALAGGTQTQSFGYDALDRLTSASASGGAGGTYSQSYSYDANGRPSTGPLGSGYTYDVSRKHAVASVGGNSFGYDLNGNMTARAENGSSYTQSYDAENRLVSVTGVTNATFLYDGDGNRVKGTVNDQITRYIGNHYEVSLGICSGQTTPGSTNWQAYGASDLYVDVDTSACGFATAPLYFTNLGGNSSHWVTNGATSIYQPTATGFRIYLRYNAGTITPAAANASGWHINWAAIPNNQTTTQLCSGRTLAGNTAWQVYNSNGVYVDVDTTACGWTTPPLYTTSLGGNSSHWVTTGATSIYQPTATGFRVYVYYTVGTITPAQANAAGWHLNWLATPTPTVAANLCSGQTSPSSNWQVYNSSGLYLDVNTTACGLSNTPLYLTALGGNSSHWVTEGATSIYSPTPTGFRVYVFYRAGTITPAEAVASGWHINWVAVSGNYHTLRKYYYAGAQRVALRQNNTVYWLLGDHLGSTAYTVNGTTETGETRYYPWGKDRFTSGQTLTSYKFTGQREEASLGLYYYGARWYDPALGRFIQPDTIVPNPRDAQSFDRYAYVNNNPLKYVDPTGHQACAASMPCPSLPDIQQMMAALKQMGPYAAPAAVAAAGGTMGVAGGVLMVNYVLNEEPVGIPPLYPGLAPDVEQGNILITVPIPDSTTLVSGVPLLSDDVSPINGSSPAAPVTGPLIDPLPGQTLPVIYPIEISPVAPDWGTKGAHIKVGGVELAVRPGQDGTIVFKPVFSSTGARQLNRAIQEATAQLTGDPKFRQQLYNAVQRGIEYLGQSGNAQWAAKSGELKFLQDALEKLGVQ